MDVIHSSRSSGVPLDELLERADFVSLHCPLTPETRHLIDADALARMKPTALPRQHRARRRRRPGRAARARCTSGEIAGAALDVTDPEPLPADDPLLEAPNLLVVPHVGSATVAHARADGRHGRRQPARRARRRADAAPGRREPRRRRRHRHELDPPARRRRRRRRRRASSSAARSSPGLGEGVDADRPPRRRRRSSACSTSLARLRARRSSGTAASGAVAVMTSAVRDAANGAEFADARARALRPRRAHAQRRRGGAAHLPRRDRARRDDATPLLVIDIGGGSTELVVGARGEVRFHVSTQIGVVRHSERHLHSDPPTARSSTRSRATADASRGGRPRRRSASASRAAVAVAGTATSVRRRSTSASSPTTPRASRATCSSLEHLRRDPRPARRAAAGGAPRDARPATPTAPRRSSPASSS